MSSPARQKSRGRLAGWAAVIFGTLIVGGVGAYLWLLNRPLSPIESAKAAYAKGDWNAAEASAREALRQEISNRDAIRILARTSARLGRDDQAQTLFRQLGASDAQAEDLFLLGSTVLKQGQDGQAMVLFERAKDADKSHRETLETLGELYQRLEFPKAAEEIALALKSLKGDSIRADWLLGRAREAIGDAPGAELAYRALIEANPKQGQGGIDLNDLKLRLARVCLRQSKADLAIETLQSLDPAASKPEADWLRSRAYLQKGDKARFQTLEASADAFREAHQTLPEPAAYLGSQACIPCHETIGKAHAVSHHFKTFERSGELLGHTKQQTSFGKDPSDPRLSYRITAEGERVKVEAKSGDTTIEALAAYALGSGNRGRSLIVRDKAGQAREYRLTDYANGVGWDLTMHHPERPSSLADTLGQPLIEDSVWACVNCHTTDAHNSEVKGSPLAIEKGIGCERCHGPGGNHVKAVDLKLEDWAIIRPQLAPASERVMLCSQCHKAPRGDSTLTRDSARFPWPKLGQSRCFTESGGALDCVTCHSPHRDVKPVAANFEAKCLACHSGKPLESTGKKPAICPVNPKDKCLGCHMPPVPNAIPHTTFTDHLIKVRKNEGLTP